MACRCRQAIYMQTELRIARGGSPQSRNLPPWSFRFSDPYALSVRVEGRDVELPRELSDELGLRDEPDLLDESESLARPLLPEEPKSLDRLGCLPLPEPVLRLLSIIETSTADCPQLGNCAGRVCDGYEGKTGASLSR